MPLFPLSTHEMHQSDTAAVTVTRPGNLLPCHRCCIPPSHQSLEAVGLSFTAFRRVSSADTGLTSDRTRKDLRPFNRLLLLLLQLWSLHAMGRRGSVTRRLYGCLWQVEYPKGAITTQSQCKISLPLLLGTADHASATNESNTTPQYMSRP